MSDSQIEGSHRLPPAPGLSTGRGELGPLEALVHTRIVRLNAMAFAAVVGIMAALVLFLMTNYLVLKGGSVVGPHLALLGQIFIGYRVTFVGSLIGAAWAGAMGLAVGYVAARIYNAIAALREK